MSTIQFTELEVEVSNLKAFRHMRLSRIPANWNMVTVKSNDSDSNLINWIMKNLQGRFCVFGNHHPYLIIGFEDMQDLIVFKLLDGEKGDFQNS